MSEEDVRQMLLMQKRLFNISKDAIDKARCTENTKVREFLEKAGMVSRELYFEGEKLLDGRNWPSAKRRKKNAQ